MEFRKMVMITLYAKEKKWHMYRKDFLTLWEKARVGCFERTASKHVYHVGWNRSPAPGWMHETSARAWCTGKTQRDRVERVVGGGIGMGNTCKPMADSCHVWQKPLQYCKVISLQLIKINEKIYIYLMKKINKYILGICLRIRVKTMEFLSI